jgi:hypothetical protein
VWSAAGARVCLVGCATVSGFLARPLPLVCGRVRVEWLLFSGATFSGGSYRVFTKHKMPGPQIIRVVLVSMGSMRVKDFDHKGD